MAANGSFTSLKVWCSFEYPQSDWGDGHDIAYDAGKGKNAAESDIDVLVGKRARADGQGQEIDVITDGLRLAIAHAVKLLEALPRERAVTLKRT